MLFCGLFLISSFSIKANAEVDNEGISIPQYSYTIYDFFLNSGYSNVIYRKEETDNVKSIYSVPAHTITGTNKNGSSVSHLHGTLYKSGTSYSFTGAFLSNEQSTTTINETVSSYQITSNSQQKNVSQIMVTLPILKGAYSSTRKFWLEKNEIYYFSFFASVDYSVKLSEMTFSNGTTFENGGHDFTNQMVKYVFKLDYKGESGFYSLNFPAVPEVIPIYFGTYNSASDEALQAMGLKSKQIVLQEKANELTTQQTQAQKQQHDEKMDTSKVSEVGGIAESLQNVANERFEGLLYPIEWAILTAHNLASAPATGVISLPGIFGADSFQIDLTVFERELPSVWFFIQNFIRFIISFGIFKGILALFKGVDG